MPRLLARSRNSWSGSFGRSAMSFSVSMMIWRSLRKYCGTRLIPVTPWPVVATFSCGPRKVTKRVSERVRLPVGWRLS